MGTAGSSKETCNKIHRSSLSLYATLGALVLDRATGCNGHTNKNRIKYNINSPQRSRGLDRYLAYHIGPHSALTILQISRDVRNDKNNMSVTQRSHDTAATPTLIIAPAALDTGCFKRS